MIDAWLCSWLTQIFATNVSLSILVVVIVDEE